MFADLYSSCVPLQLFWHSVYFLNVILQKWFGIVRCFSVFDIKIIIFFAKYLIKKSDIFPLHSGEFVPTGHIGYTNKTLDARYLRR